MPTTTLSPVDTAAIRGTIDPWVRHAIARDWDEFLALCTEDIVFLPPDGPAVEGDAVRPWLEDYPVIRRFEVDFDRIDGQGDLAYARGRYQMTLEIDGAPVEADGKFVDIFRKDSHGKWRYAEVIWNSNTPA